MIKKEFSIRGISMNILKKFKKNERFSFFNQTLDLLEEYDLESEQMIMLINRVKYHSNVNDMLSMTPLKHDLTPDIVEKAAQCRGYLTRVKNTIDSLRNVPEAESKALHKKLSLWLQKASPVYILTTARVDQALVMQSLTTAYDNDETIAEALEELGVDSAFKKAAALNKELIRLDNLRIVDVGHFKNVRYENREDAVFDLQLLVNEIVKMAHQPGDDQEMYQGLCRSIESRVISIRGLYETRMTRLANGEKVEDDLDEFEKFLESIDDDIDVRSEGSIETTPDSDESNSDATNNDNDSGTIE